MVAISGIECKQPRCGGAAREWLVDLAAVGRRWPLCCRVRLHAVRCCAAAALCQRHRSGPLQRPCSSPALQVTPLLPPTMQLCPCSSCCCSSSSGAGTPEGPCWTTDPCHTLATSERASSCCAAPCCAVLCCAASAAPAAACPLNSPCEQDACDPCTPAFAGTPKSLCGCSCAPSALSSLRSSSAPCCWRSCPRCRWGGGCLCWVGV